MAAGEPHTLTAHPSDSGLKITIASAFAGEVRAVVARLKAEAAGMAEPDKGKALAAIAAIEGELAKIPGAEKKWTDGKAKAEKAVGDRIKRWVAKGKLKTQAEADAMSQQLLAEKKQTLFQPIEKLLGDQIRELSKLASMKQFVDAPGIRKLPPGYDVRTRLYVLGSGWKTSSTGWRATEKASLVQEVRQILAGGYTPAARAKLEDLDDAYKLPDGALERFDVKQLTENDIANTAYEVDHETPLAQHWVADGHKQADSQRRAHCVDQNKWRLITQVWNRRLRADGHQYGQQRQLEASFTSEIADGGIPNAKRIDGRPLLDQDERPIA
jgi:hypothetical protein